MEDYFQQVHRSFIIDVNFDMLISNYSTKDNYQEQNLKFIEKFNFLDPTLIFPLGVFLNLIEIRAHSHTKFKNKLSFLMVIMVITSLIIHSIALLNFVPISIQNTTMPARSIMAYSKLTCKLSSYLFHTTTALVSWLMLFVNFGVYFNLVNTEKRESPAFKSFTKKLYTEVVLTIV
jgi:hypothetical protein